MSNPSARPAYAPGLFRAVVDDALDGVVLLSAAGAPLYVNPVMERMLGHSASELARCRGLELVHPDDAPTASKLVCELLQRPGGSTTFELRVRHKGCGWRWMETTATNLLHDPDVGAIVTHHRDVTEHRQALETMREGEARLNEAQHNAQIGSWRCLLDGSLSFSDQMYELFKLPRGVAPTSEAALAVIHPEDRAASQEAFARARESGAFEINREYRVVWPDGQIRTLLSLGKIHRDANGRVVESVGTVQDVTDRRQTEDSLRHAQERERRAVSAANVGLWDWDLRSHRVYFSPEWKSQIGYADHEISDDFNEWQGRLHPEDLDRCLQAVEAFLANPGPRYELEFRFRHKDGSYRHILARGSLLRDEHGEPVRLLGSHVDVTERVQLQAQLLQAQKMESVGQLAGGVAHDFNNMLSVVLSYGELVLADLQPGEPMHDDVTEICKAGRRAADLTRQLLMFSRQQVLEPRVLDLNELLSGMDKMLRRVLGEDIELATVLAPALGRVRVDQGSIEQLIMNLAVNARDAMPAGGKLTLETANVVIDHAYAKAHLGSTLGPHVMIAVSDSGTGMDRATQARIFEPFFTTKERSKGTGLGLSTVFGIVKQSGGSVWVYSEPGRGSTFKVLLPRVDTAVQRLRSKAVQATARGSETVLLVEDDDQVRAVACGILLRHGYQVLAARNAGEALLLCEKHPSTIHLLLSDVVMPHMGGPELAKRVAAIRPTIRVLCMSGYTDDTAVRHGLVEAEFAYLQKPLTVDTLTRKVREVLDAPARS